MNSPFSKRTEWPLGLNEVTSCLQQLKDQKIDILDLTQSNPTHCGFDYPAEIYQALAKKENVRYAPEPQGMLMARQEVCDYYRRQGITVDPSQVFLTASTSEAYTFLFRLLANPGDEILFPIPSYPLFQFLCDINDVEMLTYSLKYQQGWSVDVAQLASLAKRKIKALTVVHPNNPTGTYVNREQRAKINDICASHHWALICDEVFFEYPLQDNLPRESFATNTQVLTFVMGGLSKALAMPQMKLSWIIVNGPQKLKEEAIKRLEVIDDTYLSVNTPSQNALKDWFKLQGAIQPQVQKRIRQNLEHLKSEMDKVKVWRALSAEGGWYAVIFLGELIDEEAWVLELLKKQRVFVHPGYFFDFEEEGYVVVSLLPEPEAFQEAVRRMISHGV